MHSKQTWWFVLSLVECVVHWKLQFSVNMKHGKTHETKKKKKKQKKNEFARSPRFHRLNTLYYLYLLIIATVLFLRYENTKNSYTFFSPRVRFERKMFHINIDKYFAIYDLQTHQKKNRTKREKMSEKNTSKIDFNTIWNGHGHSHTRVCSNTLTLSHSHIHKTFFQFQFYWHLLKEMSMCVLCCV